jgi:hypothetical protein
MYKAIKRYIQESIIDDIRHTFKKPEVGEVWRHIIFDPNPFHKSREFDVLIISRIGRYIKYKFSDESVDSSSIGHFKSEGFFCLRKADGYEY